MFAGRPGMTLKVPEVRSLGHSRLSSLGVDGSCGSGIFPPVVTACNRPPPEPLFSLFPRSVLIKE